MENINSSEGVTFINSFDIDNDGDLDLLSGDFYNVKWFENVGGNNTQIISHTIADFGATFCTFSDIDNDGDMDVVAHSSGGISWIENNDGRGNFNSPVTIVNASTIHSIFIIDFDNDNDNDILYSFSGWSNSGIIWLENTTGNGTFVSNTIPLSSNSRAIYALDIDNDNDIDIFSFDNNTQKIKRLTNNGSLNFTSQIITNGRNNNYGTIIFADIDNDNDKDLICSNSAGYTNSIEELNIFKNDGLGNLTLFRTLVTNGIGLSQIITKDLDNDNDLDIIVSCYNDDKVSWFKNNDGQGNFGNIQVVNNLNGVKSVCAYDFDGDYKIDILSASQIDDKIVWQKNLNGQGNFGQENILTRSINGPIKSITSDIDNDGDKDVITISDSDGKVSWYKNLDGQGNFGEQNLIGAELINTGNVIDVDIDGDGDMDIVTGENYSNTTSKLVWYENLNGLGNFSAEQLISYTSGISGLASGDFDNDGDFDLIYTTVWVDSTMLWLKNDGQGNFTGQSIPITPNNGHGNQIFITDINNDGKKDIALQYTNGLYWYSNNGTGIFTENTIGNLFYQGHSFGIADIDGDGDFDYVSANLSSYYGNNKIIWCENLDGNGNFGPIKIVDQNIPGSSFGGYSIEIQLNDLDSDGDIDIIGRSENNSTIIWYENLDGIGNFYGHRVLFNETGYNLNSIFLDDLNNDGYNDILASIVNDNYLNLIETDKVIYYKNSGPAYNKINGFVRVGLNLDDCNLPANNLKVITTNGTDTFETFTTNTGYYQFYVEPGTYTTTISSTIEHFDISAPISYNTIFTGIGNIDVGNFCLYPSQIVNDLSVVLIPINEARPGFESNYQIVFNNTGNTRLSGNVKLNFDSTKLIFNSSSSTPNVITNNSLTFDYLNLNPFETRKIDLVFSVLAPPIVEIDNILTYTLSILPADNDLTPEDNTYILNQTVIGSFDPNDIKCFEGDKIYLEETSKYLHYLIRFQNTGTASAINVKIENILDEKLDWNSFQLINSSHNNRVEIINGNSISFIFDKINLPHSAANEELSNGFIAYKIKPKSNVEIGDIFSNKADIFFDFNLPITTNIALTEIVENNTDNNENDLSEFNFHPIPVSEILTIESENEILKIEIFNELGQLILFNSNKNSINILNLSSGIYFCKVTDKNNRSEIKKILKK
jgi:hypothetical protein